MSVVLESQGSLYAPRKVGVLNSKEFVTLTEGEEDNQALDAEPAFLLSQADAESKNTSMTSGLTTAAKRLPNCACGGTPNVW